jgi:ribonuclease BN (tRNA processing enzyme)
VRLTIVGCGDAFGSGGRANTCFWIEAGALTVALDFGATSLVELKRRGLDHGRLDAIVLSHLHGDHFGGIPFLLLDCQYAKRRTRPLTIVGPVGTRARIEAAVENAFPGNFGTAWTFPLRIVDLPARTPHRLGRMSVSTLEVVHPSGAPATGVRLTAGRRTLAFSGDTSWTDALIELAAGAHLFLAECHKFEGDPVAHLSLEKLTTHRGDLKADRIMLTHMSDAMLGRMDEARARGFLLADDGLVLDV